MSLLINAVSAFAFELIDTSISRSKLSLLFHSVHKISSQLSVLIAFWKSIIISAKSYRYLAVGKKCVTCQQTSELYKIPAERPTEYAFFQIAIKLDRWTWQRYFARYFDCQFCWDVICSFTINTHELLVNNSASIWLESLIAISELWIWRISQLLTA